MTNPDVMSILERLGALISDSHIVYTSGRHGSAYLNKDALYPHTAETRDVCLHMARPFAVSTIEVVAGPTVGGVILAQWVAHHLSAANDAPVLALYAEEEHEGETRRRVFRRGYDALLVGRRVLVVEDVLTTGGSARQVVEAVRAAGGEPVGVSALCNRGGITAETLGVPRFVSQVELSLESWEAAVCPLCQQGVPINTSVGKGAAFLATRQ
jgi:orotate phosphoribosyltransferase